MTAPHLQHAPIHRPSGLAARFAQLRSDTLRLAAPLTAEDCQVQSMPDASPTKWHLAHTTWFFETFVLEVHAPDFVPFDADFRVLFNSYYQGVGDQHPRSQRGLVTRPTLDEVLAYRAHVDAQVQQLLAVRGDDTALATLVALGLHHEQQHQELLLTDIKHALSFSPGHAPYAKRWPMAQVQPQPLRWCRFDGGLVEHGFDAARDGDFAFDNETPRHRVFVAPFELASRPVTHGDFLAFIADGGYRQPSHWLSMGWDWVRAGKRVAPLYWQAVDGGWQLHTLQGCVDIDPRTPVCHLSYFEADAFARWAGARLPTEQEWELAARSLPPSPRLAGNFADSGAFHPMPAPHDGGGAPLLLFGDVWEWTQSSYAAYPGYRPLPGAVGEYNGKFMCNQYVLRGGSCATPAGHVRASYRNFFPPDAQWQFSGLRLARDLATGGTG